MLPGPPLSTLTGTLAVGARVSVHLGRTTTVADLPVSGVVVDATVDRTVRRQVTVTTTSDFVPTAPLDQVNNFGHRLHVWQVLQTARGQTFEVDLGWFLVEDWQESEDGTRMHIEAVDLLRLVETDVAAWPSSPPKNQRLRAELQRLVGESLPVMYAGADSLVDPELQWETDRLANLADLCGAYGLDFRMRPDGYLHVITLTDEVVESYEATVLAGPRQAPPRKPNRWLAVGSKTDGSGDNAKETRWAFEAKTDQAPYTPTVYGIVRDRIEVAAATSQKMVTAAANQAMQRDVPVIGARSYAIVPDPRLELGDVAAFITHDGVTVGRVQALSWDLVDPHAVMRVDVDIIG